MTRRVAAEPQLDHLGDHLAPASGVERAHARVDLDRAAPPAHRHEEDGARGMPLGEAGKHAPGAPDPLGRRPDDVRHRARAEVGHRVVVLPAAAPGELALDLGDDTHGL